MTDKPKKVSVTALKAHTHDGKAYDEGDTYDLDETLVESLKAQGMAKPSDEAEAEAKAAKAAAKSAGTHPVTPMSTDDMPTTPKPRK